MTTQYRLKDGDPDYLATVQGGVIDIRSPRRSYSCVVEDAAYILLCEAKAINHLLESLDEKRQRIAELEAALKGGAT